jgi:PAS domain-containing protein/ActR/RegA family two-component response regulator
MQDELTRVLLIDASEHDCDITCDLLSETRELRLDVQWCGTLHEGLERLRREIFDVIVVDLCLPDSKGLDTFLKLSAQAPGTAVVILTSMVYESVAVEAVRRGAQDCLVKGEVDDRRLESALYYAIERQKNKNSLTLQYATARALADTNDLEEASMRVIQDLCSVLHWDCGSLFVHDEQFDVMCFKQFWCDPMLDLPEFERETKTRKFPQGIGLPGRVLAAGVPLWLTRLSDDSRFPRANVARFEGLSSGFGFPITFQGRVVAVIELYSRRSRKMDLHTMEMFSAMGSQFGQWMQRRHAENKLEEQRQVLQFILASIPDGVVVADSTGKFLLFNPAAEAITGMGLTDSRPNEWSQIYGCYLPDKVTPFPTDELPLVRAIRGEEVNDVEIFLRNAIVPEGLSITVSARPVLDESGTCIGGVVVFRDITQRKRVEEFRDEVSEMVASDREPGGIADKVRDYLACWKDISET